MNWVYVADVALVVGAFALMLMMLFVLGELMLGRSLSCAFRGHQWVHWQEKPGEVYFRQCCRAGCGRRFWQRREGCKRWRTEHSTFWT